jgi:hypothetical protein
MPKQKSTTVKGCKKAGRNKKTPNPAMSNFVKGKITFSEYAKHK